MAQKHSVLVGFRFSSVNKKKPHLSLEHTDEDDEG